MGVSFPNCKCSLSMPRYMDRHGQKTIYRKSTTVISMYVLGLSSICTHVFVCKERVAVLPLSV